MKNEETQSMEWSNKWTFVLAAIGSAVGLGNIWRYPTIVFNNGGGAFFIPYFIAFFVAGLPMLILEFVLGARMRGTAPLAYARITNKRWEFLGWIPTVVAAMIVFFYVVILAWAVNFIYFAFNTSWGDASNAQNFFMNEFLGSTGNPLDLGAMNWWVALALLALWGGTYFVMAKGIKGGLEKANNILLPLFFLSLLILLVWGVTLDGAANGLNALFTPDFARLTDTSIWIAAFGQIFFSLSVCMGIMVAYGSYLPKDGEIVNTALIIGFADILMSMIAATAVFSILGYMATAQGVEVAEVVTAGAGLVFMVFPAAFSLMGAVGPWFGTFFFVALLVAGWTSFISLLEAFSQPFVEKFNMERKKMFAYTCAFGFLASLLYATGAGIHLLGIVNYVIDYFLMIGGFLQVLVCFWLYKKAPDFKEFANRNAAVKLGAWWDVLAKYVFPIIVLVIVSQWVDAFVNGTAQNFPTEVLIFVHGGTAVLMIVAVILFSAIKWKKDIYEDVDTEEAV